MPGLKVRNASDLSSFPPWFIESFPPFCKYSKLKYKRSNNLNWEVGNFVKM